MSGGSDPITKITWDNVISVSRITSEELNLKHGEMAELRLGEEKVEAPFGCSYC